MRPGTRILLLALVAIVLLTPFMRTTADLYSPDTTSYYTVVDELITDQDISRGTPFRGLVNRSGSYHPATPIGYGLLTAPVALMTGVTRPPQRWAEFDAVSGAQRNRYIDDPRATFFLGPEATFSISRNAGYDGFRFEGYIRSIDGPRNVSISVDGHRQRTLQVTDSYSPFTIRGESLLRRAQLQLATADCTPLNEELDQANTSFCTSLLVKRLNGGSIWINLPEIVTAIGEGEEPADSTVTAQIRNPNEIPVERRLVLHGGLPGTETTLTGWIGDEEQEAFSYTLDGGEQPIITPAIVLPPGNTTLHLTTDADCDTACLRDGLDGPELVAPGSFGGPHHRLTGDWYRQEDSGTRWMHGPASIVTQDVETVSFQVRSYQQPRRLQIGGTEDETIWIDGSWTSVTLDLDQQRERLRLQTGQDCTSPAAVTASDDQRCLATAIRDLTLHTGRW